MIGENNSPFAVVGFEQMHRDGQRMAVVAVRARYRLTPDGELFRDASAMTLSDVYEGAPASTPLLTASDLAPFRPFGDVTLVGIAYAPDDQPRNSWNVGLRVDGDSHVLTVFGPREWRPTKFGANAVFALGEAQPAAQAPINWRVASGGRIIGDPTGAADPRNPIGPGLIDDRYTSTRHSYAAPTLESPQARIYDPLDRPDPCGFGPIPPSWRQRLQYAGAYDENWRKTRQPRLPAEFDYRFYQSSHPSLWRRGYLRAGAAVSLGRLTPGGGRVDFTVPDEEPYAIFKWIDGREVIARTNRDGLHIDLTGEPPWIVEITFRVWLEICPRFYKADLGYTDARGAADLPGCNEFGLTEPSA